MENKVFSKSKDGHVSNSEADGEKSRNIDPCEDPSMKEMSDVVTLLSDGQMVCWNSDTISGIQLWPLLMATRAPLVAKKLCQMEMFVTEPIYNTLFWSHIHFVHESIGHISGLLEKEKSTDIYRVDHCVRW